MLEFLFLILVFMVFGKILVFSIKAAWGLSKIIVSVVLFPLILVGLILKGLFAIAVPILAIVGLFALFGLRD